MAKTVTPDQVLRAARELKQSEFTRDDLAGELGVGKPKFKAARESGDVEKVRDGDDRKGRFHRRVARTSTARHADSTARRARGRHRGKHRPT